MKSLLVILVIFISTLFLQAQPVQVSSGMFGMMEARHIGPAVMGGRITAIDAVNADSRTIYVGTAGGGIWKTTTGGSYFKPVFDKYIQSIGALTIDQNNPEVVWAGTGESNMRNTVSIGNGIYKTTDGGNNWVRMGLDSTEHISRIILHPKDPNIIYVAAPGPLWSNSPHRGLYKSTDGGKTWSNILFINNKTGCAEVLMNPEQPDILYASTWEFRRTPYSFTSGGKGSGVYKSIDGGKTWNKLTSGLPNSEFGRVAMALAPSKPENLFAIVEAKQTSLFLSANGGESWQEQGSNSNVAGRPFYFSVITVDPKDPMRVYRPAYSLSISDDGGRSFFEASFAGGWVHSDHHALWINPNNTSHQYLGTDGGVYMSLDRGNNWIFLNNIPVSQFYHVAIDKANPYNVMGGLQDNGSWIGPSQSIGGIKNGDWDNIGGGDGFWVQPDQRDPDIFYSEYQGGNAFRINRRTNEYADIQPKAAFGEPKLRFNWNTPIVTSALNDEVIYMAAQYVFKSRDRGISWEKISPDLTTNDPKKQDQENSGGVTPDNSSAENHCTIFTLCESPLDESLLFAGTDDGNLQLTTNGGKTWMNIAPSANIVPKGAWVSSIEASRFSKNRVYATFDNHMYGDMKTYCAVSNDLGKTWTQLTVDKIQAAYAHKIREDLISPELLFLGTELGLYISLDGGKNWFQHTAKVPPVAVRDMQIHAGSNDLILATHGRGILILDDISAFRQLNEQKLNASISILSSRPYPVSGGRWGGAFPNAGGFVGPNSSEEAQIVYYLKDRITTGNLKIEIVDANGISMGTVPASKRKGINLVSWSMRMKPPKVATSVKIDGSGFYGPLVDPGTYTVRITRDGKEAVEGSIVLVPDPLTPHSSDDRALQRSTTMELFKLTEDLAFLNQQILVQLNHLDRLSSDKNSKALQKQIQVYKEKLNTIRKELVATKGGLAITGEEKIREKLSSLYASVMSYAGRPSKSQLENAKTLREEINKQKEKAALLWKNDLPSINLSLKKEKREELTVLSREEFEKSESGNIPAGSKGLNFSWNFFPGFN